MDRNKLGILNFQYSNHNYGAVLQAAALHEFVTKQTKYQAEHIDYIPLDYSDLITSKIKQKVKKWLIKFGYQNDKVHHAYFLNPSVFEEFRSKWLPRTNNQYRTIDSLEQADFSYSHIIVGSDQVWRLAYTNNLSAVYFLDFVKPTIKRISYAASFGNEIWCEDEETTVNVTEALSKFHSISVREESGLSIASDIFSVDATHVLDPTLLIGRNFFETIIQKNPVYNHVPSVVYYKLDIDADFTTAIHSISSDLECSSTNIYYKSTKKGFEYYPVEEWLAFISNSKIVITDSFHCVCFAILFNKPFICYPNKNRGLTRLESLLGSLGLKNLILRNPEQITELIQQASEIDYDRVNANLAGLRLNSASFLINSLAE